MQQHQEEEIRIILEWIQCIFTRTRGLTFLHVMCGKFK